MHKHKGVDQAWWANFKTKTIQSAGKVMPTVFWDSRGIIDYLQHSEYFASFLDWLSKKIKVKSPHLTKKSLDHKDIAPSTIR